jgi:hypothetical protein
MRYEYRVIPYDALAPLAQLFKLPSSQRREYATLVEDALNRMGAEGWHLVDSFTIYSGVLFVFRRECVDDIAKTGIKAASGRV